MEQVRFDPEPTLLDPEFPRDPYPLYDLLLSGHRVYRSNQMGYWFVSGYDEIKNILLDPVRFSSTGWDERYLMDLPLDAAAELPNITAHFAFPSLFASDPPVHTRLRRLVHRVFTPSAINNLRGAIQTTVGDLLDRAGPTEPLDLLSDLAVPLPVSVFAHMFGIPESAHGMLKDASADFTRFVSNVSPREEDAREADASLGVFRAHLLEIFAARRADPLEDLATVFVSPDSQGDVLSDDELLSICAHLLIAGHETTTNLIANGLLALLGHPRQLAILREDRARLPAAIEEMLRWETPLQRVKRMTTESVEVAGVTIPPGERLMLLVGAGNRDPSIFSRPGVFDFMLPRKPHLAFGHGIHFCIGAALARLEAEIAISAVIGRFPTLQVVEGWVPEWNPSLLRGLKALPVWLTDPQRPRAEVEV